jgi:hypothetical protein
MDQPGENSKKRGRFARGPLPPAVGLGLDIAVGFAALAFGGYWMDQRAGLGGIRWTLAGAGLGFLFAGYEVWKVVRKIDAGPRGSASVLPDDSAKPADKGRREGGGS